jgi:hypothetical protein
LKLAVNLLKYPKFSREESQILHETIMNADIQISADASLRIKANQ